MGRMNGGRFRGAGVAGEDTVAVANGAGWVGARIPRPQEARSASDGYPGGDFGGGGERDGVGRVFPALALGAS